jgi:hypothetical protein
MDIAYLSTLSALAGSAVGGLTSGVATWLSQRVQARESQLAREMARRDDLYKEFIAAASKAYGEAIVSNEPNVQEFVALYAMISRMRLQSPPQTIACAEKIMRATIDTYFAPGRTIREFHELAQSGSGIDLQGLQRSRARGGIHNAVTVYRPNFLRPRSAQNFVNGFLSKLLPGFEPAVRIMSMRARNVAGTWRCPG